MGRKGIELAGKRASPTTKPDPGLAGPGTMYRSAKRLFADRQVIA